MVDAKLASTTTTISLVFYLPDLSHATQSLVLLERRRDTLIQVSSADAAAVDIAPDLTQILKTSYHRDPILVSSSSSPDFQTSLLPELLKTVELLIQVSSSFPPVAEYGSETLPIDQLAEAHNKLGILILVDQGDGLSLTVTKTHPTNLISLQAETPTALANQAAQVIMDLLIYTRLTARSQRWANHYQSPRLLLESHDLAVVQTWQAKLIDSPSYKQISLGPLQLDFLSASQKALQGDPNQGQSPRSVDVFVSYSRRNTPFVQKLYRSLKQKGLRLWVDWENIPVASDWWAEIEEALQTVHTVLFVISPSSAVSKYCRQEIEVAQRLQKRIVPILLEPVGDEGSVHPYVRRYQRLSFVDSAHFELMTDQIYQAIQTDLDHVKFHTKLFNQATDWSKGNCSPDLLLRGSFLTQAQHWLTVSQALQKQPLPTDLHQQYIKESDRLRQRRRSYRLGILVGLPSLLLLFLTITLVSLRSELKNLIASISSHDQGMETLIETIYAGQNVKRKWWLFPVSGSNLKAQAISALQREINNLQEKNHFEGHDGSVYKVLFTPDGGKLISAGGDAKVGVWPLKQYQTRPQQQLLKEHEQDVVALDISPDGQLFASGGYDGRVVLWNTAQVHPIKLLKTSSNSKVFALAFDRTSNYLAAGDGGGKVYLWQKTKDFSRPQELSHDGKAVYSLSFSPDGQQLATADSGGIIKLWTPDGKLEAELNHGPSVLSLVFTRDGKQLISAGFNGSLKVWDLATGTATSLDGPKDRINQVAISPNGHLLAAASQDKTVTIWQRQSRQESFALLTTLTAHTAPVFRVKFSPDNRFLVTAGAGGQLNLWSIEDNDRQIKLLSPLQGHTNDVLGLDFNPNPDSAELASSSRDGSIRLWNLQQPYLILPHENDVLDVAFKPHARTILTTGVKNVWRWDQNNDHTYSSYKVAELSGKITTADYSADGQYLVLGSDNGQINLREADSGVSKSVELNHQTSEQGKTYAHPNGVKLIRFRPQVNTTNPTSSEVFASMGSNDRLVRIWNLNGQLIQSLEHEHPVTALSWSKDGRYLVTSSQLQGTDSRNGSQIKVWEVTSAANNTLQLEVTHQPISVESSVISLQFVPTSKTHEFAAVGEDGPIKIWSIDDGKVHRVLRNDADLSVALKKRVSADFNATGSLFATLDDKGYVTLWSMSTGRPLYTSQFHTEQGRSLRFNPENPYQLVTTGADNRAVIVDLPPGVETNGLDLFLAQACHLAKDYLQSPPNQISLAQSLVVEPFQASQKLCIDSNPKHE